MAKNNKEVNQKVNRIIAEDIKNICRNEINFDFFKNKTVLITGAKGGIASYLVRVFLYLSKSRYCNIRVLAMCRNLEKSKQFFEEYANNSNFNLVINDVKEPFDCINEKVDIIFHTSNSKEVFVSSLKDSNDVYDLIESNVIGFHNVLSATKRLKTHMVVLFSSASVYGESDIDYGISESYRSTIDFSSVGNTYRICKQMMEAMANAYKMKNPDLIFRVIRPFTVYGPCLGNASKNNHITDFIKSKLKGQPVIINSKGSDIRSYLYISDAIEAILHICMHGDENPYNLTGSNVASIKEFAEIVASYDGEQMPVFIGNKNDAVKRNSIYIGDGTRLKNLGWHEFYTLREGVERTINWAKTSNFLNS